MFPSFIGAYSELLKRLAPSPDPSIVPSFCAEIGTVLHNSGTLHLLAYNWHKWSTRIHKGLITCKNAVCMQEILPEIRAMCVLYCATVTPCI